MSSRVTNCVDHCGMNCPEWMTCPDSPAYRETAAPPAERPCSYHKALEARVARLEGRLAGVRRVLEGEGEP